MNELVYITLLAMIIVFLYNVYLLFFSTPNKNNAPIKVMDSWKKSLFIFIVSLIIFFLFFGSAMNSIQQETTYDLGDGSPDITVKDNRYMDAFTFLPLMNMLLLVNFFILLIQVFKEFRNFGKTSFSKKGASKFRH
jgi:hypothetical protein